MVKFLMNETFTQDDGVTDYIVNQSKRTEDDPKRVAYHVEVHEKVQTSCLFDTGVDAHVMPTYAWEQLREPTLQPTRVTLSVKSIPPTTEN